MIGQLLTLFDATAELATPAAVVLGVLGGGPALIRRTRTIEPWALGCAAAVFLIYGAPILLSGDATFSGYIKLDDTATWMAFTDRTMEFGRNLDGLAPSSYEATLDLNLVKGYPTAIFVPWGIGAAISAQDLAWVFEPYEALLASMLALCLNAIAVPAVRSARMRALIALVAALGRAARRILAVGRGQGGRRLRCSSHSSPRWRCCRCATASGASAPRCRSRSRPRRCSGR